jgi:hypothetical protein
MTVAEIDKYVSKELQALLLPDEVDLLFLVRRVRENGNGKIEAQVTGSKINYIHETFGHKLPLVNNKIKA